MVDAGSREPSTDSCARSVPRLAERARVVEFGLCTPCLLTVKTASRPAAVQVVCSSHRGSRDIEHIGSAHDDAELEVLKAVARQCVTASQGPRPSDPCLAMAKRDSLIRAAHGWTARQARASEPRR